VAVQARDRADAADLAVWCVAERDLFIAGSLD
jgi:hypothetical protein